jgi:hypothetical protein
VRTITRRVVGLDVVLVRATYQNLTTCGAR